MTFPVIASFGVNQSPTENADYIWHWRILGLPDRLGGGFGRLKTRIGCPTCLNVGFWNRLAVPELPRRAQACLSTFYTPCGPTLPGHLRQLLVKILLSRGGACKKREQNGENGKYANDS